MAAALEASCHEKPYWKYIDTTDVVEAVTRFFFYILKNRYSSPGTKNIAIFSCNTLKQGMTHLDVLDKARYEKMLNEKQLIISYAFDNTQFGECLIAFLDRKICHLSFVNGKRDERFQLLKREWPGASFVDDSKAGKSLLEEIFEENANMEVLVRGTQFQEKVWKALLLIKRGDTVYYSDVADAIGCPKAHRAVANAVAKNPVSYLVPCHRVICKSGDIYKYGGGSSTKKKLLTYEGFKE